MQLPHSRWNINLCQILVAEGCVWGRDSRGAWCHLHVIYKEGKQSGRLCVTPLHSDVLLLQSVTAQYQHLLPSDSCGDLINCEWNSPHTFLWQLRCLTHFAWANLIDILWLIWKLELDLWKEIQQRNKPKPRVSWKQTKKSLKTKTKQKLYKNDPKNEYASTGIFLSGRKVRQWTLKILIFIESEFNSDSLIPILLFPPQPSAIVSLLMPGDSWLKGNIFTSSISSVLDVCFVFSLSSSGILSRITSTQTFSCRLLSTFVATGLSHWAPVDGDCCRREYPLQSRQLKSFLQISLVTASLNRRLCCYINTCIMHTVHQKTNFLFLVIKIIWIEW